MLIFHFRCPCYGNDEDCVINGLDYMCDCKQDTNTMGNICETCQDEFYREPSDLDCQYPCNCTAGGSKTHTCEKVNFIGPVKHIFQPKIAIIYLSISLNICFGSSKNHLIETAFF